MSNHETMQDLYVPGGTTTASCSGAYVRGPEATYMPHIRLSSKHDLLILFTASQF